MAVYSEKEMVLEVDLVNISRTAGIEVYLPFEHAVLCKRNVCCLRSVYTRGGLGYLEVGLGCHNFSSCLNLCLHHYHSLEERKFECWSAYAIRFHQRVTKRCRLSWLTNSAFVYETRYGGRGVVGCLSQWVQLCTWSPNKCCRSNSIFNPWASHTAGAKYFLAWVRVRIRGNTFQFLYWLRSHTSCRNDFNEQRQLTTSDSSTFTVPPKTYLSKFHRST